MMPVTISLYNQTARLFADGSNAAADTYKLALYTAATFNAANTTLAGVTKTEVASGAGYTTGGQTLAGVSVSTVTTNDARFDANDVVWTASGGPITASFAILYNDTDAGDPPLAFIDFGGSQSAGDTTDFKVVWDANGIFTFTVA
jgi:hypothetical protein